MKKLQHQAKYNIEEKRQNMSRLKGKSNTTRTKDTTRIIKIKGTDKRRIIKQILI